jgi:hypothetical protein
MLLVKMEGSKLGEVGCGASITASKVGHMVEHDM